MASYDSGLATKISPLIDGQVPDFIQADHPLFVKFLEHYYKFLESAQLTISGTVNFVSLETVSSNTLLLDATDFESSNAGEKIVLESALGTTGKFEVGETITGGTSKATATILVDNNTVLYTSSNQKFIEGETLTGATSGATTTLTKYRANPVQNIQQLLEYLNPDNTVDHFLTAFRDSFMASIPNTLASGLSKRNLIKSIKDLYSAKGTSEGHKLFFRIFLGEEATIDYPAKYMIRTSDGNWNNPTRIRCTSDSSGAIPSEMVGQEITGASSGTKAQIVTYSTFQQGSDTIVEFGLRKDTIEGSGFTTSETFTGTTISTDVSMQYTIQGVVTDVVVSDGGLLYSVGDSITFDSTAGNNKAEAQISEVSSGSISDIIIDAAGTGYRVGDAIRFTATSDDTDVASARAFVSVAGGRLSFNGTDSSSTDADDVIVLEPATIQQFATQNLLLNGTSVFSTTATEPYVVNGTDRKYSDSQKYYYPLYVTKARADAANTLNTGSQPHTFVEFPFLTFYMPKNDVNTAKDTYDSSTYDLFAGVGDRQDEGFKLRLESGEASGGGTGIGDFILSEEEIIVTDTYGTDTDGLILEQGTYSANEDGELNRVFLANSGQGYTALPTLTVLSDNGASASVFAQTKDIGAILDIKIIDPGFKYSTTAEPTVNTHALVKDISGTFAIGNTLSSHSGKIVSFDSDTQIITINSKPVNKISGESSGTFNDPIELEPVGLAGAGDVHHTQVGQKYSLLGEVGAGFDINNHIENGGTITLEDGNGVIISDNFDVDTFQISMEQNLDSTADTEIRLEDNLYVAADEPRRFLLDGDLSFKLAGEVSVRFVVDGESGGLRPSLALEPATSTNVFGEEDATNIIFDRTFDGGADDSNAERAGAVLLESGTSSDVFLAALVLEGTNAAGDNSGDFVLYDSHTITEGGQVFLEDVTSLLPQDNSSAIILESSPSGNTGGSNSYLINEAGGNSIILNGTDSDSLNYGEHLLMSIFDLANVPFSQLEQSHGQSIPHGNTGDARILGEGLETIVLENSGPTLDHAVQKVLYDTVIFDGDHTDGIGNIILNGTDSSSTNAGSILLSELSGLNLLLNGTDSSSTNAGSSILMEEDVSSIDSIVLDGIDSSSTDADAYVILEDAFDVTGNTITDSSGATATIVSSSTASLTGSFGTTIELDGSYLNSDSLISEDTIRIQDSNFYQQFSYEVTVNATLSDYMEELKRAVHPAGFKPFGKVSFATEVSAAISTTAAGVADFTADTDTFSPELASLFTTIFTEQESVKHGVSEGVLDTLGGSSIYDSMLVENGVAMGDQIVLDGELVSILLETSTTDNLVLDGTDGSSTDAGSDLLFETLEHSGDNILFESGITVARENSQSAGDGTLLLEAGAGGGRLLSETALGKTQTRNRSVMHLTTVKLTSNLRPVTAYGPPMGSGVEPGTTFIEAAACQLEAGTRTRHPLITEDTLLLNGTNASSANAGDRLIWEQDENDEAGIKGSDLPTGISTSDLVVSNTLGFTEPSGQPSGGYLVDVGNSALLNGTDSSSANAGDNLILDGTDASSTNAGSNIVFDSTGLRDVAANEGSIIFEQSSASDELVLEEFLHFSMEGNEVRGEAILLETGHYLIKETIDGFRLYEPGKITVESGSEDNAFITASTNEVLTLEEATSILLEDSNVDNLILNGTDSSSTDADDDIIFENGVYAPVPTYLLGEDIGVGDNSINLITEDGTFVFRGNNIITETVKIDMEAGTDDGSVPEGNFGSGETAPFTREAQISSVNQTNRISLQDEYETGLAIALDGTDGSGTDAGDNIIFDGDIPFLDTDDKVLINATDGSGSDAGDNIILDASAVGTDVGDDLLLNTTGATTGGTLLAFRSIYNLVAGNEGGFILLNGTDGSSTNAGDELLLESGTLEHLDATTLLVSDSKTSEGGGLQVLDVEAQTTTTTIVDGVEVETTVLSATSWDSGIDTFDLGTTTLDGG